LSREALGVAVFFAGLCAYTFLMIVNYWLQVPVINAMANAVAVTNILSAAAGLWFMHNIYRIRARPFWNHWQVMTSFFGTTASLGGLLIGLVMLPTLWLTGADLSVATMLVSGLIAIGLVAELIGLTAHARYLNRESGEGAAAHYIQLTTFGKTYWLRNGLLVAAAALACALCVFTSSTFITLALLPVLAVATFGALVIGRALFYVLVIPTTMPGAFFWKNKGFEEHARDIGLANMPQVGVVPHLH